jgi:hypothetical protein
MGITRTTASGSLAAATASSIREKRAALNMDGQRCDQTYAAIIPFGLAAMFHMSTVRALYEMAPTNLCGRQLCR